MRIIIPTYRRVDAQHTWDALPPVWKQRTTFVVDVEDAAAMVQRVSNVTVVKPNKPAKWGAQIVVHPPTVTSIAQKRAWILRNCLEDRIVMMDDDLRFAVRAGVGGTKLVPATEKAMDLYLCELFNQLILYAHAGFGARQGNNQQPAGWVENTRMMYVLGYRPAIVREFCELGRIETREDFDYTLQLLRFGYRNTVCHSICVDQKYNAPGGASLERTTERSNADAHKLAELHPGLVRVEERDYNSSIKRLEVTVAWKKAYNSGLSR